jgi:signal transduction histidine kinase
MGFHSPWAERVVQAERWIASAEQHVTRQRGIVARLAASGLDSSSAREFLAVVEKSLTGFHAYREHLLKEDSAPGEPGLAFQDNDRAEASRERAAERELRLRLIAEVGSVLATTPGFEDTLTSLAELVVENLRGLCIINFIDDHEIVRRVRVFSSDPAKAWVCAALMRMPADGEQPRIARSALETKEPSLVTNVTPDLVRSWAASEEQLAALQEINPKSVLSVPLMVRERLVGALSLLAPDSLAPADVRLITAVAERAAVFVENARLYDSAKKAIRARDDLLGVVAHDLRNPLMTISALGAYLRKVGPEDEVGAEIEQAVNRMNRLIQDLLDVTRLEAGHLSHKPEGIDSIHLLREALEAETPVALSAGLELQLEDPSQLPDIWADRDRLFQVFDNLIGNAIKFTKPGGRITLAATAHAGEVQFSVSDTGCGIASDQLTRIFDRFWQAPGVRRGAGLGLPIVKGIVESHGGRVWVESPPGKGSTFFFAIPAAPNAIARSGWPCHSTYPPRTRCALLAHAP